MQESNIFLSEFTQWIEKAISPHQFFWCVYWSYPSHSFSENSDLDFFCGLEKYSEQDLRSLIAYIVDFYEKKGIPLDEEVPFGNKILATHEEIESAINLGWFKFTDGRMIIPNIEKTQAFLSSLPIKKRLILNALTTPHFVFWVNFNKYKNYLTSAEKNIVLMAIIIINKTKFTLNEILSTLTVWENWEEWEDYLGYKRDNLLVIDYLGNLIKRQIGHLLTRSIVNLRGEVIEIIAPWYFDKFKSTIS